MTVEGLINTGLVAGTAMFMGFGMMKMVESNVNTLIKDGKKQRPMHPPQRQQKPKSTSQNFFGYNPIKPYKQMNLNKGFRY
jgi:hypothetical protein